MIRITFNVHDLWDDVLGFVTNCVNDYAAAHGAIWTSAARFCRARYLQPLRLRVDRSKAEAEGREPSASDNRGLDKRSSRDFHGLPPIGNRFIQMMMN
jgi:hypothetical protein